MRREAKGFTRHGLFVDDMVHTSTSAKLMEEVIPKYSKDFDIAWGGLVKLLFGMQIERGAKKIQLRLDLYVQEMPTKRKGYVMESLRHKRVPINPGLVRGLDGGLGGEAVTSRASPPGPPPTPSW